MSKTITLRFKGNSEIEHEYDKEDFDKLLESGMLWELYPDAPETFPSFGEVDKEQEEKYKEDLLLFEVVDRSYTVLTILQILLDEHPALLKRPGLRDTYSTAEQALLELYQQATNAE